MKESANEKSSRLGASLGCADSSARDTAKVQSGPSSPAGLGESADVGLPTGWAAATLDDLGTWKGGGTPRKSNSSFWTNGTVPWVSPKDMKRFFIDDAQDLITTEAVKESSAQLLPENSVMVVTRSGILERVLPVAINTVPVATNQDLKTLVPEDDILSLIHI